VAAKNLLTVLFFALSLYCFGGGFVEGFQYSSWKLIAPADFPAVHQQVERRIERYYVPFLLLSLPVTILLIWIHHPAMARPKIVIAALLQTYIVVSTLVVAVPIQKRLGQALSPALVDKLIWYHTWLRLGPGLVHLVIVLLLLYEVVRGV
jgi:hypothetical protein